MTDELPGWDQATAKRIRQAVEKDAAAVETLTDNLAGFDAWVDAVARAAYPVIEAAIRQHIAQQIETQAAAVFASQPGDADYRETLRETARRAMGVAALIARESNTPGRGV